MTVRNPNTWKLEITFRRLLSKYYKENSACSQLKDSTIIICQNLWVELK